MRRRAWQLPLLAVAYCTTFIACTPTPEQPAAPQAWQLTVAHVNDHHSHLLPMQRTSLTINGSEQQLETGGFARVVSQIEAIRGAHENVLALHAGDAITGTLFYTLFKGEADAALMNQVCFDAFALGNHEFDSGDAGLKTFLDFLSQGDCSTVVLGANVAPEVGVSPLTPKTRWDSFKPYTIFVMGEQRVGLIGLDIAQKTKQSSMPDKTTMFADEYETAAYYIEVLRRQGVEKIGLLTHITYRNDLKLAARLPAVDFIIGGDSHTLQGDFARYGLATVGPYPMQVRNAEGDPVCVAHAWQYSQVVGELVLQFNGDVISACGGQAHLLVDEQQAALLNDHAGLTAIAPDPETVALLDAFQAQLTERTDQQIAWVAERICMQRSGVTSIAECGLGRQSDAHRLVAEAFLQSVPTADFSLQNAGGVRREITAGPMTVADVYRLLPFSNTLVEIEITGAELKTVLEQALTYSVSDGGSAGAYPHGAGIQFDIDMTAGDGARVSNLALVNGAEIVPIAPDRSYRMVTNSFLATGADGWRLLADLNAAGKVTDTYVNYAQSFVDWLRQQERVTRPNMHSTRHYRD